MANSVSFPTSQIADVNLSHTGMTFGCHLFILQLEEWARGYGFWRFEG